MLFVTEQAWFYKIAALRFCPFSSCEIVFAAGLLSSGPDPQGQTSMLMFHRVRLHGKYFSFVSLRVH